ncbi:MAG TPA: iron-containing alcohol dehydrogenase [Acidimicrobiales bacterium]|nr:iron-containing alcohol dehydrogenase [Acidimicrobiales bacterium]
MSRLDTVVVDTLEELRSLVRESPDAASLYPLGIKEIVRGRGALQTLVEVLVRRGVNEGSTITVLSDTTPKRYKEDDVLNVVLAILQVNFHVELVRLAPESPASTVHADEATVAHALENARRDAPAGLLSVGSGTVVDIGKMVAHRLSLPHVVVQTAASVNGFSDDQSVLLIDGVKRTTPSQWPGALVIDPDVIADAPIEMTRSGLGDQLSMFSAAADWYLAGVVGFDTSYSSTPVSMMRRDVDELIEKVDELGQGDQGAVDLLASCLTAGGLAMGVAGRTAPSSGTEHLVSHLLEMHGNARGISTASHGSQVGAASVFAAIVWQYVRQRLNAGDARVDPSNIADYERVRDAFTHLDDAGALAEECWVAYQRKARWMTMNLEHISDVIGEWRAHGDELDRLLGPPALVADALRRARAPVKFQQLDPAPDDLVVAWAATNCHLMRDRFTVVDLANLIGAWTTDDVARALAQQNTLGQ